MQEAGSSFIFSVIGELRFETLPAVPGKLSIAVNHTGNPTSQTIWLEGRNLCDLRVERSTSTRISKSEWIYIFDWAYYCLCCKMPRLWMDLVETSEQTHCCQFPELLLCGCGKANECFWVPMVDPDMNAWLGYECSMLQEKYGECDVEAVCSYLLDWLEMQPLNLQLLTVWEQQSSYAFMASSLYEQCVGAVGMMHMYCIAVSSWRQSFSDLQLDGCKGQVDSSDGQ